MYQLAISMTLFLAAAGCQCCAVTQRWADAIDDIADCEPALECLYRPGCDLNRIGELDGP